MTVSKKRETTRRTSSAWSCRRLRPIVSAGELSSAARAAAVYTTQQQQHIATSHSYGIHTTHTSMTPSGIYLRHKFLHVSVQYSPHKAICKYIKQRWWFIPILTGSETYIQYLTLLTSQHHYHCIKLPCVMCYVAVVGGWLVGRLTSPFSIKVGYIGDKVVGGDIVPPGWGWPTV